MPQAHGASSSKGQAAAKQSAGTAIKKILQRPGPASAPKSTPKSKPAAKPTSTPTTKPQSKPTGAPKSMATGTSAPRSMPTGAPKEGAVPAAAAAAATSYSAGVPADDFPALGAPSRSYPALSTSAAATRKPRPAGPGVLQVKANKAAPPGWPIVKKQANAQSERAKGNKPKPRGEGPTATLAGFGDLIDAQLRVKELAKGQ